MQEISLNILDVAQNAVSAGATLITIAVEEQTKADTLTVTIGDNGCGMSEQVLAKVTDPFYTTRTTRKVGLGVPLFKMAAEMSGGSFSIASRVGEGTTVCARFGRSHIDRMPLGDLNGTVLALIQCNPALDFVYTRKTDGREFTLDTRAMREILGDVPLSEAKVLAFIRDYLEEGEQEIGQPEDNDTFTQGREFGLE